MIRPRKPPGDAASCRIDLRVTQAERDAYEQAAKQSNQTLSAWIKQRLGKAVRRELRRG